MTMERRDRQNKKSPRLASSGHRVRVEMPVAFGRLRVSAKGDTSLQFNNLMCQLKVDLLRAAFHKIDNRKARGTDGMTKQRYGENLEANLQDLEDRLHRGSYKPKVSRQILIPKGNGKMRPIAISNLEDKIVQGAMALILEAIYEPIFIDSSLGFRPRKGCQKATRRAYHMLKENKRPYVVDADIERFFDSIEHERLMEFLRNRIVDKRFLKIVNKLLKVGVLTENGQIEWNEKGSPQGSVVSPILANIYLHYVIDTWFNEQVESHYQKMVRYADDTIFCFKKKQEAVAFTKKLEAKLRDNHLQLNEEKTKIVNFKRENKEVFDFLGFTYYWGKDRKRRDTLKMKTSAKKLRQSIQDFNSWIKNNRNSYKLKDLWKKAAEKLRGHFAYFGVYGNKKVGFFYKVCVEILYKWLNRRSQKRSMSWQKFHNRLKLYPLPKPILWDLLKLQQGVMDCVI